MMLAYLSWRIATGKSKRILFNFLMTGHTRLTPDRFFGLFKQRFGKYDINSFEDIMECVRDSTVSGQNEAVDAYNVKWYKWDEFFRKMYRHLPGMSQYHHFTFTKNLVLYKLLANDEFQETTLQIV